MADRITVKNISNQIAVILCSMKGNYNLVAPFYDRLSRLIFGNAIVDAQNFLIKSIPPNCRILIVGGGTGWLLEMIAQKQSEGLQITYVDISAKMIALAKKRNIAGNKVVFVNSPIQAVTLTNTFDVIITPFLLDNFAADTAAAVFNKLDSLLKTNGHWLFADFEVDEKHHLWQKPLLKVMYLFFRTVCNIEASQLPDTRALFKNYRYRMGSSANFFRHFICSVVYIKENSF